MENINDHQHRQHAILSASSSARWMNCTPSAQLCAKVESEAPMEEESSYAAEGTLAHELAEQCLNSYLKGEPLPRYDGVDDESINKSKILKQVMPYVSAVTRLFETVCAADAEAKLLPEVRVDYSNVAKEGFGTSDCIIIGNRQLYVIDLKFGKGLRIDATGNSQLRLYAIGALNRFDHYDSIFGSSFDSVCMTIVQPRLNHISQEVMKPEELMQWGDEVLKPAADLAWKGEGDFHPGGDTCRFCKAKGVCPALLARNKAMLDLPKEYPNADMLTDDEVASLLPKVGELRKWMSEMETYALDHAILGQKFTGYKIVEGRGKRVWENEQDAAALLEKCGLSADEIYPKQIITPAQALDMVDEDQKADLLAVTVYQSGKPKLVPDSDPRAEIPQAKLDEQFALNEEE